MLILYFTETHVKENNMWFGNVILIVGIIGVAFSGTSGYHVCKNYYKTIDCYFVCFLNNYCIKFKSKLLFQ